MKTRIRIMTRYDAVLVYCGLMILVKYKYMGGVLQNSVEYLRRQCIVHFCRHTRIMMRTGAFAGQIIKFIA